jgi:hypothetical protein
MKWKQCLLIRLCLSAAFILSNIVMVVTSKFRPTNKNPTYLSMCLPESGWVLLVTISGTTTFSLPGKIHRHCILTYASTGVFLPENISKWKRIVKSVLKEKWEKDGDGWNTSSEMWPLYTSCDVRKVCSYYVPLLLYIIFLDKLTNPVKLRNKVTQPWCK